MMAKQSYGDLWHAGRNWEDLWFNLRCLCIESFRDLLRSGFTIIGNPHPLYCKKISMCEGQETQIIILLQGINVTEQESMASLLSAQSKLIFTW